MQANSLWFRLIASSVVIAAVLLLGSAVFLNSLFVKALQRNFDGRLRSALDGILAGVELQPDGSVRLQSPPDDSRFSLPVSGWYWQVNEAGNTEALITSPSLLEQRLPLPGPKDDVANGFAAYSGRDANDANLRIVAEEVSLFGKPKKYAILVAGNFDELKGEIQNFQRSMFALLGALGIALLSALVLQVRFGLRPIADMREQLGRIRAGRQEFLGSGYPVEIQPLAAELNQLVEANLEIVERSRMQVGNLAHALKTPISVITNETRGQTSPLADTVQEQLAVIRDQVNLYLDRARRAARAKGVGAATEIEPVVAALARTLQRINASKGITFEVKVDPVLRFRGERQDLEEMLGNLMDNASKWSARHIRVRATAAPPNSETARAMVQIDVDDDGPGIPAAKRADALRRGQRLDESKPGSGLGMSIISETAAMYGGTFTLADSDLGGLSARLKLPMVE